jgi:zinc transport system substrate-binding protein
MRLAMMAAALAVLAGCGSSAQSDGKVHIVAGFYPLQYLAQQVGGDRVSVTNLVQPGAEPHDLELSPHQVAEVADAKLVVYLAGFQPALDSAARQEAAGSSLELTSVVPLLEKNGGKDPHIWLDPNRFANAATAMADRLATVDPEGASGYRERAAALVTRLHELDRTYAQKLAACPRREIVVSHAAFGYLAERYHLTEIAITGLSPDAEPTPQRLGEVAEQVRTYHVTTIFFEALGSPKVAQAVADETGASTAVLDPIEGIPPGSDADYVSVMRDNLSQLEKALGCPS